MACENRRGEFHAAKCEHENEFELYKDLTQIVANSGMHGHGVALKLAALREFFPTMHEDIGYYKCFMMVIIWLLRNVAAKLNQPMEFTFDMRPESNYNAGRLYDLMANKPEWQPNILMSDKISFATRANPRIQMADLVARETMKCLDNQIRLDPIPPRKSFLALTRARALTVG